MTARDSLRDKLSGYLNSLAAKPARKSVLQALVHSDKLGLDIRSATIEPDRPFHTASVGKMFTATLVGMLADEGHLRLEDAISSYLPVPAMAGLFVHKGTDFRDKITIRDLLAHRSGVADYFESDPHAGSRFVDTILKDPDRMWTPDLLLAYTRDHLKPFGPPGEFHYSDTGYILLGLIIENLAGKPFHAVLTEKIFHPLEMHDSYLMFSGRPRNPIREIAPIWFNSREVSKLNLLSCDWAGGGIVSTLEDLLRFQTAFWMGRLAAMETVAEMAAVQGKFRAGMHYGLGVMQLRFHELFFLLRGLPAPKGHSGSLSTHMYFDAENDLHVVLNMGSNLMMPAAIRVLIQIESIVKRSA